MARSPRACFQFMYETGRLRSDPLFALCAILLDGDFFLLFLLAPPANFCAQFSIFDREFSSYCSTTTLSAQQGKQQQNCANGHLQYGNDSFPTAAYAGDRHRPGQSFVLPHQPFPLRGIHGAAPWGYRRQGWGRSVFT